MPILSPKDISEVDLQKKRSILVVLCTEVVLILEGGYTVMYVPPQTYCNSFEGGRTKMSKDYIQQ